jgi:O-antigen ligase
MGNSLSKYNRFYIFLFIIWTPLHRYVLHFDAAGRTVVFLSVLAVLLNLSELWKQRKAVATPAFLCWTVLLCYSLINATIKGFSSDGGAFFFYKVNFLEPFIFLIITTLELYKDKQKTLKTIWTAIGVYLLLGLPFLGRSTTDRVMAQGLGNLHPLMSVTFLFITSMLFAERKIKTRLFIAIALFVSFIVLVSGTRKAFGAEIILLLGVVFYSGGKNTLWRWIRIALVGVMLLVGVRIAINNSRVGERLIEGLDEETALAWSEYDIQLVNNQAANNLLVNLLDDRAIQYALGLDLFREHPWTGIGLTNFIEESGYPCRLHTEYMVHLCENGIVGFALLIFFYVLMIKSLRKRDGAERPRAVGMALFGLIAILFLNITAWTYNADFAMIVYAVIFAYANTNKMRSEK